MAEYISLTELLKKFDELVCPEFNLNSEAGRMFLACKKAIITTPTADVVEVVRCKDCIHAVEFDKHCDISRTAYRHCGLLRGEETKNVWHKYKKYYKDYSLVELDGYCDEGVLKEREG